MEITSRNATRSLCIRIGCVLALSLTATAQTSGPLRLTYIDLVSRLTDLEYPATLPVPGEKCLQWSSWDRASRYDEAAGKYVKWDANGDGNGIIRKEGDELVFAEIEGPAVIWRIWSALAKEGHVKIYLDGQAEPAVDLPFIGYFNRENTPFVFPALVHEAARGQNCYVPIPFQKSCKITASGDWGAYYHFTYTTYPKGTILPTFTRKLTEEELHALDRANTVLSPKGAGIESRRKGQLKMTEAVKVAPGKTVTVARIEGERAISGIDVSLPVAEGDLDTLRDLTLHMYWDGQSQPSVWSPLGDFFGTAPGVNKYESFPLGVTDSGFFSRWYMPFQKGAEIKVTNDGDKPQTIRFIITHAPLTKPIDTLGRFHAKWHRDAFLPDDPERRKIDWTMLKTEGRGRFCGVMLHVWNPRGGWWGEGDEKFFVDGEKFPSTFGTGSEDYFGYAWCNPTLFENCYHNQTISNNNKGHVSVNRWHLTDNVPFQNSFEAAIEKYYPNAKPTLYAATVYWYQAAGQKAPYEPVAVEQRTGYWTPIETFKIKGAIEGEALPILSKTGGNTTTQDMSGWGEVWSNEAQLWWTEGKPGNTLELGLPVEKAGTYRLIVQLTKAIDYGIVQLSLDDKQLGDPIDLYNDGVVATGPVDLGTHELSQGRHVLKVEIVGANEKAVKSHMFGRDYVKLESPASSKELPSAAARVGASF